MFNLIGVEGVEFLSLHGPDVEGGVGLAAGSDDKPFAIGHVNS